ncbi:hypothetical protein UlMin_020318 [Ulmus minor]
MFEEQVVIFIYIISQKAINRMVIEDWQHSGSTIYYLFVGILLLWKAYDLNMMEILIRIGNCKKLVDVDSKAVLDKAKISVPYAVDAVLEQIKKKQKLSVLDKMKTDWHEFKEENKGLEDELDAYKKSSNQYLDKVFFLQRTDYREFERERYARLAI